MYDPLLNHQQIYAILYHLPSLKWEVETDDNAAIIRSVDTNDVVHVTGDNWANMVSKVLLGLEYTVGGKAAVEIHRHFRYIVQNCNSRSKAASYDALGLYQELWQTAVMNQRGTHSVKVRNIINEIYHRIRGHADLDDCSANW